MRLTGYQSDPDFPLKHPGQSNGKLFWLPWPFLSRLMHSQILPGLCLRLSPWIEPNSGRSYSLVFALHLEPLNTSPNCLLGFHCFWLVFGCLRNKTNSQWFLRLRFGLWPSFCKNRQSSSPRHFDLKFRLWEPPRQSFLWTSLIFSWRNSLLYVPQEPLPKMCLGCDVTAGAHRLQSGNVGLMAGIRITTLFWERWRRDGESHTEKFKKTKKKRKFSATPFFSGTSPFSPKHCTFLQRTCIGIHVLCFLEEKFAYAKEKKKKNRIAQLVIAMTNWKQLLELHLIHLWCWNISFFCSYANF